MNTLSGIVGPSRLADGRKRLVAVRIDLRDSGAAEASHYGSYVTARNQKMPARAQGAAGAAARPCRHGRGLGDTSPGELRHPFRPLRDDLSKLPVICGPSP